MTLKDFYDQIQGNYQEAISRMMNDAFVLKMLTRFYEKDELENLLNAYQEKNFADVFSFAHALKGVSGNLALSNFYKLIQDITEKTRHHENSKELNLDQELMLLKEEYKKEVDAFSQIDR